MGTKIGKELDAANNLAEAFFALAQRDPEALVYSQAVHKAGAGDDEPREWRGRNYREVRHRIEKIMGFLRSKGFEEGDKAAIISTSRPEWMEADIAIVALGGTSVSIYQTLPTHDTGYIVFDSGAKIVFAENQEQYQKLQELCLEPIRIPATEDRPEQSVQIHLDAIVSFEPVETGSKEVTSLDEVLEGDFAKPVQDLWRGIRRDHLAALVYTSGTTGPPKGVMQTHGNHLANVRQAWDCGLVHEEASIMLFLPLAHAFAKLMGYIGFLSPVKLQFPAICDPTSSKMDPESVTKDIREANANIVPVVPRLLEKMQAGIVQKSNAGGIGGVLLRYLLWSSRKVYQANSQGRSAGILAMIGHDGLAGIRRKIEQRLFGADFFYCISGGAKLNPEVGRFFDMLGIEVLEGYGLTETCVATNVNRAGNKKIGTVGPTLSDDIELSLEPDGEILFRGPNIAVGYYGRPTATKAAWDDSGWFHTGDLGDIDDDGFLTIVGRKKEILVTSYGKNIAPEEVEGIVKSSAYISQIVLIGDGRPFCTALIALDEPSVRAWANRTGVTIGSKNPANVPAVRDLIQEEITVANERLAHHEQIRNFALLAEEFTIENGFLTPTFKVKRNAVTKHFHDLIEDLYKERS